MSFTTTAHCPFCAAARPLSFSETPGYTCGYCEGIRSGERHAVCAKCDFDFCPICVQVPTTDACGDAHPFQGADERTQLLCFGCGKECHGKETAHARCGVCGVRCCLKCGPIEAPKPVETASHAPAAAPTAPAANGAGSAAVTSPTTASPAASSAASAATPGQTPSAPPLTLPRITFVAGKSGKKLEVLTAPGSSLLDALEAAGAVRPSQIRAWRTAEGEGGVVFSLGDGVRVAPLAPVEALAGATVRFEAAGGYLVQGTDY
ncbi:hypothetical protein DFJ74DRAFT_115485 [Hyaloraphidium curvatum]|nr:hypothetical protein DFJ74DRAFT_115485 [Hyaloraphidium curvatum]